MRFLLSLLLSFISPFILISCATQTAPQAPLNQTVGWDARSRALTAITHWNITGMLAIRNPKENISANLHWQQQGTHYTLDLFGPMGSNAFKLTGSEREVALQNPRGQVFHATSPEQLLLQQTGWNLPVSNLSYWVRGLPVPGIPVQKHLDSYNHLTQLEQQGWQVQYLRYTAANHIDLPTKIFLQTKDLRVKLIISNWQLE